MLIYYGVGSKAVIKCLQNLRVVEIEPTLGIPFGQPVILQLLENLTRFCRVNEGESSRFEAGELLVQSLHQPIISCEDRSIMSCIIRVGEPVNLFVPELSVFEHNKECLLDHRGERRGRTERLVIGAYSDHCRLCSSPVAPLQIENRELRDGDRLFWSPGLRPSPQ